MRKSSKGSRGSLKAEQPPAGGDDVKVKAVNEMMERIKHGVVLRPTKGPDNKRMAVKLPAPPEEKHQESAMEELKGILETVKRSPSRGSQEPAPSPPGKKDSELQVILRRRRNKAGEPGSGDEKEGHMSHVSSSSDSLNWRRTSTGSGKEPEGPGGAPGVPGVPSDPTGGPRVNLERRGSGPGPVVARRKSSDVKEPRVSSWQERRSRSSLSEKGPPESPLEKGPPESPLEKGTPESPLTNGCIVSGEDSVLKTPETCAAQSNGVVHTRAVEEDTHATLSPRAAEDTHATLSPSFPAGPGPVNGNADAEC